jgi:hypothetical protein
MSAANARLRRSTVEALLTHRYSSPVRVDAWERLEPWAVARVTLRGVAAPRTVVVKWVRNHPSETRTEPWRLRAELAALRFLSDDLGLALAPRVIAADLPKGLMVLEDLAPRTALDHLLRRDGAAAHCDRLAVFARAYGELNAATGFTDVTGKPLHFAPHDFRRIFTTDAVMNGMPPHIAQLVLGHRDINTTMGYKAVYPEEAINGHRAFIARRRELRPSEEYRSPTEQEWEEFLSHFERRKVALGDCGRAYGTTCIHEHSCVRCPPLRADPAQRPRLVDIRDNLIACVTEAEREGWGGEAEGLTGQPGRSER